MNVTSLFNIGSDLAYIDGAIHGVLACLVCLVILCLLVLFVKGDVKTRVSVLIAVLMFLFWSSDRVTPAKPEPRKPDVVKPAKSPWWKIWGGRDGRQPVGDDPFRAEMEATREAIRKATAGGNISPDG